LSLQNTATKRNDGEKPFQLMENFHKFCPFYEKEILVERKKRAEIAVTEFNHPNLRTQSLSFSFSATSQ
jgi:hypothetical protein